MSRCSNLSSSLVAMVSVAVLGACSSASGTGPSESLTIRGSAAAPPAAASFASYRGSVSASATTGDPSSLSVGMYALYISRNADCSSPVMVEDNGSSAVFKDFVVNPVLFTGTPASGAYQCLMIKMSDVIHFSPATSWGACTAGTVYYGDIYRDGEDDWKDKDMASIAGHGSDALPVDDRVTIFITRDPSAVEARGASPNQTIALGSDLVVPGHTTFYWNGAGSVSDAGGECGINPGRPSFH